MTRSVTPREVGLLRLVAQGLVGAAPTTGPVQAVRHLLAVQAQDLPGALRSVALRTAARSRADVVAALDAGTLVRSWPVRGTLHLLAAEDLGWLLRTTAVRVLPRLVARQAELDLDAATVEHAADVADRALAAAPADRPGPGSTGTATTVTGTTGTGSPGLRRKELLAAWEDAGISTTGQRGYHLVVHLAHTGLLCLGPMAGTEQLFVRTADRVPGLDQAAATTGAAAGRGEPEEQALRELALRYFLGHGPATVADLVRWASVTLRQARTGLALARDGLTNLDVDGAEHWLDPAVPDRLSGCRREAERVRLLPGFDEYLLGYADRSAVLAPEHAPRVVPGGNGVFRATVVDAGRVVGTWRHVPARRGTASASVDVEPFTVLPAAVHAAAVAAHADLP